MAMLNQQCDELSRHNALKEAELDVSRQNLSECRESLAALRATLKAEQSSSEQKLAVLQDAQQLLRQQFENLANRIFDDKQQRFKDDSKAMLEASLSPLKQQLG